MIAETNGLPQRRLGRTEFMPPVVALGGAGYGGIWGGPVTEQEAIATIHRALDLGINWIDTSPFYGDSERRIGLALKGERRDKVYISTKTGTHPERPQDYSREATLWSVQNSLKLLGTDYLDVCLIHDPQDMAAPLAPGAALDTLVQLKEKGVVRFIGLGVAGHEKHFRALETGKFDVLLTPGFYTLLYHPPETEKLWSLAAKQDVGIINAAILHGGLLGSDPVKRLSQKEPGSLTKEEALALRIGKWAQEKGLDFLSIVMQFSLRHPLPASTLMGAKSPQEIEADVKAALAPVPDWAWKQLEEILAAEQR